MTSTLANFRSICTKIICIGRNYSEHASELGNAVPSKPMIFMKPPSAFVIEPNDIKIPSEWDELHHEVELGIIIDKKCQNVSKEQAVENIGGFCLALDMTGRKIQDELKNQGHPWLLAKGFDTSCPCGDFIDKNQINPASSVNLWLSVNDKIRQNGHTRDMIFSIPDLIVYISKYITLEHGDLILTGTPAGVGPVKRGDQIEAGINGDNNFKYTMKFNIVDLIDMPQIAKEKLTALMLEYPKPSGIALGYGTAGFRARADTLPWIMIRIGLLASLRSKVKQACIGAMITASHNPEHDNGVKLIDPRGEMLDQSWEVFANNLSSLDDDINILWDYLETLMTQLNVQLHDEATIAVAYDTRQSSPLLSNILKQAAKIFYANVMDFELLTTPQLHYTVRCCNDGGFYGHYTEAGYFDKLCTAFRNLLEMTPDAKRPGLLAIDAANGVGAQKLINLRQTLADFLPIEIFNDGTIGHLNEKCGADYVKLYQKAPDGLPLTNYPKYCSIDGDADRLVYFFIDENHDFHMLDGDRFSVLFASFIATKLEEAKLLDQVKMGVIQTAYANGSSTNYIVNIMKVPIACVPTGVKHLHHKALDYDIGIYFEANGHGTVLFSNDFKNKLRTATEDENRTETERLAANQLRVFIDIINETVGDAIADLLATEAILSVMNLSIEDWLNLYTDLPQRQLKVAVRDRTLIQTTDAERRCIAPAHLQDCIDELVTKYPSGRSFVRPSGTEDIVRVYAEAETQVDADKLADEVRTIVEELTK